MQLSTAEDIARRAAELEGKNHWLIKSPIDLSAAMVLINGGLSPLRVSIKFIDTTLHLDRLLDFLKSLEPRVLVRAINIDINHCPSAESLQLSKKRLAICRQTT